MAGTSTYPTTADALTKTAVDNPDVVDAVVTVQAVHRRDKTVQTLNPIAAAAVAIDCSLGLHVILNFPAGNLSLAAPVNMQVGDVLTIQFVQDGVGSRTITAWNAIFTRAGGAVTLTITAAGVDEMSFRYDSAKFREIARSLAQA